MFLSVKTMRDIWDKKRKEKTAEKYLRLTRTKPFPPDVEKHHLVHLARKKAFLETKGEITKTFADYENRLGNAGFLKI